MPNLLQAEVATPLSTLGDKVLGDIDYKPAILAACRAASVKSPAASRAALARHRASIDPELIKILETVGNYEDEVIIFFCLLLISVCQLVQDACLCSFLDIVYSFVPTHRTALRRFTDVQGETMQTLPGFSLLLAQMCLPRTQ